MPESTDNKEKTGVVEFFSKILMPLAVLAVSIVTLILNFSQTNERITFDQRVSEKNLSLQNNELFLKKLEHDASMKKIELDFYKDAFEQCQKEGPKSLKVIEQYAEVQFPYPENETEVMKKVRNYCIGLPPQKDINDNPRNQATDYSNNGAQNIEKKDFVKAANDYISATKNAPKDANLWNQRAYAQYKSKNLDGAMNSISIAIKIGSKNDRLNKIIAINAAKILCARGGLSDGVDYLNQAVKVYPGLFGIIKTDGELIRECALKF